ncbi:hypothetical protein Pcinc_013538 [Petrolisthes cinctipes]|uniref:Uncharacterized protein n=1 Tax=Petrolisthes cinctipes TaxID=88211 RepID=A0AAE1KU79_PETCI|nr:hypothetical protein Pcinc_013538 [Petrolisthes cinctipes]
MLGWKYKLQLGRVQKRRGLGLDSVSGLLRGARRCHQPTPQERYRSRTRQQDLLEKHEELQRSLQHPDRPHLYQQRPQGNTQPRRVGGRVLPPVPPRLQLPGGKIKSNSLRVCWRDELYATPWPPPPHPASPCHITENWVGAHRSHLWRRRRSSYSLPPLSLASRWPCTTPISKMPREYGGEDPSGAPGGEVFVLGGKSVSMGHHPGQRALSWPGEETRARRDGACMCIGGDRLRLGNGKCEKTGPRSDHPMGHQYQDHSRQTLARTSAPQRTSRKDEAVEEARMNANTPSKLSWKYMEMGRMGTEGGWVETDNPGVGTDCVDEAKTGSKDNSTKTSQPSKTKPRKPPRGRSPSRKVTMESSEQQQRHTTTNQQIPTYKHSDTKRPKHSESKCTNGVKNIQGDTAKNVIITKNQQGDTAGNLVTNKNQRNTNVTKSTSMRFYTQANSWWEKLTETSGASNHRKSKHKADATGNSIRDVGGSGGKKGGGLGYIKGPGAGGLKNCTGGKSCDALVTCTCLKGPGVTDCSSIKGKDVKAVEPSLKNCSIMKVTDKTSPDKKICSVLKNCTNVKESFTNVRESCGAVRNVCGDGVEGNASGITTLEKSSVSVDFIADDSLDQSSEGRESLETSEEVMVVKLFGGDHDTDEGFDDCDSDLTKLSRKSSTEALDQNGDGGGGGGSGGDLSWQSRVTLATLPPPPLPDGDQQHIHNWLPPDSLVVSPPISYSGPTGFTTPERTLSSATYLCQSETIVTVTPTTIFVPHTFVSATSHSPQLSSDGTCLAGHGMQTDEKSSYGGSLDHPSMLHDSLEPELEHENKSGKLNNMLDDSVGMGRPGSVLLGEVAVQESTSRPQSRSGCKPISQKVRLMLETVEAGMVTSVRPPSATAFIETRRTTTQSGSRSPICSPRSCGSPGSSPKFKSPICSPINNGKRSDVGSPFQVYDFLPRYETGSSSPYRKSGVDKTWDTLDEKEDEMESSVDEPYLPTSDIKSLVLNSGALARKETSVDDDDDDDDDNEGNWNQQYKTGRISTPDPKPFMTIKMKHNDLDRDGVVATVREKPKSGKMSQPVHTPEYLTTTGVVRTKPQLFPPSSSPLPQVPLVNDALVTDTQPCEEIYTRGGERGDINSCTSDSDFVYSEEGKANTYTQPINLHSGTSSEQQTRGCLYRERVTINQCVPGDICDEGRGKANNSVSLSDSVTCEAVICSEEGVGSATHNAAATHTHSNTDVGDILSSSSTSDQHTPLYSSGHRNSSSCSNDRNSSVSNSNRDISTNSGVVSTGTFLPPGGAAATLSSSTLNYTTIASSRVTDRNQHYPRQSPTTTTNTNSRQSPLARFTNQYHKVWEEYTKQLPSKKKTFTPRITEKEIDKIREENVSENVTCLLPEKLDTNSEVLVSGFLSPCAVSGEVDVVSRNPNPVLPEEVCVTRENSVPNERKKVRDSERTQRFRREKVSQSVSLAEDSEDSGEGDGTRRPPSLTSYLSTFNMDVSQPSPLLKHSSGSQPTQVLKTLSLTGIIKQRRGRKLPKLPTESDNVHSQAAGVDVTGVDSVDAGGVTKTLSNVPLNSVNTGSGCTGVVAGTNGVGNDSVGTSNNSSCIFSTGGVIDGGVGYVSGTGVGDTGSSDSGVSDVGSGVTTGILHGIGTGGVSDVGSGVTTGILRGIGTGGVSDVGSGVTTGILHGINTGGVSDVGSGVTTGILHGINTGGVSDVGCSVTTGILRGIDTSGVGGGNGVKIQTRERRLPVLPGGGKYHTHRHLRESGDPQGRLSPQTVVRIRDVIKFWNTKASSQNQTHQATTRLSLHSDQHPSPLSILNNNNNCHDEDNNNQKNKNNNNNNNSSERHNRRLLLLQQDGSTDSEGHVSRTSGHMRTRESDRQTITPHHHHNTLTRSTHTTLESRSTRRQDGRSWHADSENGESVPVERKVTPLTAHSEINGTQGKKATEENTVKLPGVKSGSSHTQLLQKMEIGDCVMEGRRFEDSVIENVRSVVEEGENSEVVSGCCIGGGTGMSGGREGDTEVEVGVGNETLNVEEVEVVMLEKNEFNLSLPPDYPPPPPPPDSPLVGEVSPTTDTSHTPTAHSSISSPYTSSPILHHTQVPSSTHVLLPSPSQSHHFSPIRTSQSAYGPLRLPEYTTQPTSTYTRLHTHVGVPDVPSIIVSPLSSLATLKPTNTTTTTAVTSLSTAYVASLPMYSNHHEVMNSKEVCCI